MKTYGLIMTVYGMALVLAVATMLALGGCDSQGGTEFLGSAATGPVSTNGPLFDDDGSFGDSDTGRRVGNDQCRKQGKLNGVGQFILASGKAKYEKRGNDRRISVQVEDIELAGIAGQTATVTVSGPFGMLSESVVIGCLDAACTLGSFDLNLNTRDAQHVPDFTGQTNCADATITVIVMNESGMKIVTGTMN